MSYSNLKFVRLSLKKMLKSPCYINLIRDLKLIDFPAYLWRLLNFLIISEVESSCQTHCAA